jgi:nifR3 family TIM-barrel protein
MSSSSHFRNLLARPEPLTALAPMQDITDLPFWRLIARYGGPDVYFTEYFRVYPGSRLDRNILRSLTENPTGKPAVAQMIGNDPVELARTARELQRHPVAAIDLNLGCPAPVVYRKCAGGGLLRDPDRIDRILGTLREAVAIPLTVKTRVGFDHPEGFDRLLALFARHGVDLVTVHGRTVREMYRAPVHYDLIARAVEVLSCPVLANGNVHSARHGWRVLQETGARGLMIGRGAIRNPWIFPQFRGLTPGASAGGSGPPLPTGREVLAYIEALFEATAAPGLTEIGHVQRIKKHMNFLALGVDPSGEFLHRVRRVRSPADFFALCREHLDHGQPMPLEPFELELASTDLLSGEHR